MDRDKKVSDTNAIIDGNVITTIAVKKWVTAFSEIALPDLHLLLIYIISLYNSSLLSTSMMFLRPIQ